MNLTDNRTSTTSFRSITDKAALTRGANETIVVPILSNLQISQQHYKALRSHSRFSLLSTSFPLLTFISHIFTHYLLIENHPGKQLYLLLQKSYISKSIPLAKMKSLHPFSLSVFIIYQEFLFHSFLHFLLQPTST